MTQIEWVSVNLVHVAQRQKPCCSLSCSMWGKPTGRACYFKTALIYCQGVNKVLQADVCLCGCVCACVHVRERERNIQSENVCEFVFAFPQFCLHVDLCVRAHSVRVCVCVCDTWEQPSATLERKRGGLKLPSTQQQWPWVVSAVRAKAFRWLEGKFKKTKRTKQCNTFLFHTTLGQRSTSHMHKCGECEKEILNSKEIYINCHKTAGGQWLMLRGKTYQHLHLIFGMETNSLISQYNQILNANFSDGVLQKHWVCLKVEVSCTVVVFLSKVKVKWSKCSIDCGKKLLSRNTHVLFSYCFILSGSKHFSPKCIMIISWWF